EHTGIDVLQDGADVILLDPVASALAVVDPALVALSGEVRLPPGAVVAMAAGTVVVVDPEGDGWVRQIADLASFAPLADEPDLELGAGGRAVVSVTGTVHALDVESGMLVRATPRAAGRAEVTAGPAL